MGQLLQLLAQHNLLCASRHESRDASMATSALVVAAPDAKLAFGVRVLLELLRQLFVAGGR
jgi:hypothetical protein